MSLTFFCSCWTKKSNHPTDSFKVILPDTSKSHKEYTTFEHLKILDEQMNLDDIYNGVDSFEIRIWIVSMIKPNKLFIVKQANQIITVQDFYYEYSSDYKLSFKSGQIQQNNSYSTLMDSLKKYDFAKLISQEEIDNFVDNIADGVTYTMEIATTKYYKLISYRCPEHFAHAEINNRRFLSILFLLDRYLHFYSPICSNWQKHGLQKHLQKQGWRM